MYAYIFCLKLRKKLNVLVKFKLTLRSCRHDVGFDNFVWEQIKYRDDNLQRILQSQNTHFSVYFCSYRLQTPGPESKLQSKITIFNRKT